MMELIQVFIVMPAVCIAGLMATLVVVWLAKWFLVALSCAFGDSSLMDEFLCDRQKVTWGEVLKECNPLKHPTTYWRGDECRRK